MGSPGHSYVPETDSFVSYEHIDGLVQGRLNPIADAPELRVSCTNLSI